MDGKRVLTSGAEYCEVPSDVSGTYDDKEAREGRGAAEPGVVKSERSEGLLGKGTDAAETAASEEGVSGAGCAASAGGVDMVDSEEGTGKERNERGAKGP